ncbi:MAG TPA: ribbon-helix-helix domain-containing protein [Actinomycetota bacterium]|nr:ribbon-helix-helix domain-containing protein [Actinomycetota bacterium]
MSEQIAVRIPDALAESLDELVASGRYETKADAVRSALEVMVESERRRRIGQLIVEGYRRLPQDDEELAAITSAATRSIHEEPW